MSEIVLIFTLLTGLLLPIGVLAHNDDEVVGHHMLGSGMWGGWMFMIIFWVIGITLFILFIKWVVDQGKRERQYNKTPLDVLKERYARGEIDDKEFEEKKKKLS
ncbi:MAG: SHOCT domain-containing protein [bacterium]|nr:SHOCT domain-containing protein [bacterium]